MVRRRTAWRRNRALLRGRPRSANRFPRANDNVVGLEQGWLLARTVRKAIAEDAQSGTRRPIVAIVDVKSQAYGYREETLGIHLACAAAVDAYAAHATRVILSSH